VAVVFGAQTLHLTTFQQLIAERDERAARAAATAMADQLRARAAAVDSLAIQAIAIGDSEHALEDAGYLLPEFDRGLAQFSADGVLAQSSGPDNFWTTAAIQDELAKLGDSNDQATLPRQLPVILDPATGEHILLIASVMDDGSLTAGAVTLESLAEQALGDVFSPTEQASAFVVDEKYQLLYRTGPLYWPEDGLVDHPGVAQALGGQRGAAYYEEGNGEHIIAYSPIPDVNWALVIEEPWQSVSDPVLELTELAPLVLIPALLVALFAILFGMRRIVRPLQTLEEQTSQLAQGHFEAIEEPVGGIAEIGNLQAGLVHMARSLNRAQRNLRDYLGLVTSAHEEDRGRLARDLHDDTIQSLVALTRKAQLTRMALDGRPEADELGEMEEMTAQIIDDLRRLAQGLRPAYLEELGLTPALRMLAKDTGSTLDIPVSFTVNGTERRLAQDVELALYRIAQEALNNIIRHSQATTSNITLHFDLEALELIISDDGCGFEVPAGPADLSSQGHFGILGLHERAEWIGALLDIESNPDQGTNVKVTLPLEKSA
jgi:signal transduction histidine kinase